MDQKILREYLLSLGFKADPSVKKMDGTLNGLDKRIFSLGKGLFGVGVAAQGMMAVFANSMEKMYYSSKLAESSAGRLQAASYAGKQIGLTNDQVTASIQRMASAMRSNPGLKSFLESFGVKVEGRDMSDVFTDMIRTFGKMPTFLGTQFAEMFGTDADTFFLMKEGLDEYLKAEKERIEMNKRAGIDMEEMARVGKEYAQVVRSITANFETLYTVIAKSMLPITREWAGVTNEVLKDLTRIVGVYDKRKEGQPGFWDDLNLGLREKAVSAGLLKPKSSIMGGSVRFAPGIAEEIKQRGLTGTSPVATSNFAALEARYGLPQGLLDRMWATESGRGKHMLSPKGAQGHFGFMPNTAKEWGVNDPNDLAASSEGAAKYMQYLMQRYEGDLPKALAAYNWGLGNVDKYGLGAAPPETRSYMQMANGLTIQGPQTTIVVHGSGTEVVQAVGERLERINADYIRNLSTALAQ